MNILNNILEAKRQELFQKKQIKDFEAIYKEAKQSSHQPISFKSALLESNSGIIAEFKRKSPSKGFINENANIKEIVSGYEQNGATAISVLTDSQYFGGSLEDLSRARNLVKIPILRKDFIIDPYQICEAKIAGADVILLIASALTTENAQSLGSFAHSLGVEVLLEIHNEKELAYIGKSIDVVGINNRDLNTFKTDVERSFSLGSKISEDVTKISESGISSPETVKKLKLSGFKGFLMGENFMKQASPEKELKKFISELW
jgi:indole-3-glycerol phosphate synthase